MTIWNPDTCLCVAHYETKKLLIKCDRHNSFEQMKLENDNENLRFGVSTLSEDQRNQMSVNRSVLKSTSSRSSTEQSRFINLMKKVNSVQGNKKLKDDIKNNRPVNLDE